MVTSTSSLVMFVMVYLVYYSCNGIMVISVNITTATIVEVGLKLKHSLNEEASWCKLSNNVDYCK